MTPCTYSADRCISEETLEEGLKFVERSLKLHRKSLPALNSRGLILGQLKRYREALASFDWL